ncbi:MAG: S8 family peptidase [bacterium]|nr:S8 family peptidase [bacterium]
MAERHQHLELLRAEPQNERRRGGGFGGPVPPNAGKFAKDLDEELAEHEEPPEDEVPGFDPRRLLKLTVVADAPLGDIPGLSVVSQEGSDVIVLLASEAGLTEFRSRLQAVAEGRAATRKELLFAVQAFAEVTPADRTGPALVAEGTPTGARFRVDVELWPLELSNERDLMLRNFASDCAGMNATILDKVDNHAILLQRVETNSAGLSLLLRMRDVRLVDLPPRYQLDFELLASDVSELGEIESPPEDAPGVVVLDSGLATNHPILAQAVGDAQGFTSETDTGADSSGHGTLVAGLALYGDVEACAEAGAFTPELRLFSGRIADSTGEEASEFLENRIERAVKYFKEAYGCRVFNLSFGDSRRVYAGGHVGRLAATIDTLSREHQVLFVVSAGNFRGTEAGPADWREEFPGYLLEPAGRLIDPAPALNAITVGSIARHEGSRMAIRYTEDPAYQPVARRDEPSPFTRAGPGPVEAIKPELVEYGGNAFVDVRGGRDLSPGRELGVMSASASFAGGNLFAVDRGTSYAAPRVAHLAAMILKEHPEASPDLLRALLVAHAEVPDAAKLALSEDPAKVLRLLGYGLPTNEGSRFSSERRVSLYAEETIDANQHHFFELPIPEDFSGQPVRRTRIISVAISHMPRVRRTRMEYKECGLTFRVVRAKDLQAVLQAYRRLKQGEEEPSLPESDFLPKPTVRRGGTVQCARRIHKQIDKRFERKQYFVVVTSKVPAWAPTDEAEPYALAVVIEDRSETDVRLYSQIRLQLQARARARV